jgi:tetratricopeptide (TPR) repeat protein
MPEGARILQFPDRRPVGNGRAAAALQAIEFLKVPRARRSTEMIEACLTDSDTTLAICQALRGRVDASPALVADEAISSHSWINANGSRIGLFDEKDYFLGEFALLAANAYRLLGRLTEADRWVDRAEAGFRHTVNPAPLLAAASFVRVAIRYAATNFEDVLDVLPSLIASFERFGMQRELDRGLFLRAAALKETGNFDAAIEALDDLVHSRSVSAEPAFLGRVLAALGHNWTAKGDYTKAAGYYAKALPPLQEGGLFAVVAEIKWGVGDAYRAQRSYPKAISAYREAVRDYEQLGLVGTASLLHLVLAELLLETGFAREAEKEIVAALPTLDEEKMAPAALAAVALLRESVSQRRTDPKALLELRNYLETNS